MSEPTELTKAQEIEAIKNAITDGTDVYHEIAEQLAKYRILNPEILAVLSEKDFDELVQEFPDLTIPQQLALKTNLLLIQRGLLMKKSSNQVPVPAADVSHESGPVEPSSKRQRVEQNALGSTADANEYGNSIFPPGFFSGELVITKPTRFDYVAKDGGILGMPNITSKILSSSPPNLDY